MFRNPTLSLGLFLRRASKAHVRLEIGTISSTGTPGDGSSIRKLSAPNIVPMFSLHPRSCKSDSCALQKSLRFVAMPTNRGGLLLMTFSAPARRGRRTQPTVLHTRTLGQSYH